MTIAQLNAAYVDTEDRVLFRFTTAQQEEFAFWLTRRLTQELLWLLHRQSIERLVTQQHSVNMAETIASFRQDHLAQASTFTTFVPGQAHPLGKDPLLVTACRTSHPPEPALPQLHLTLADQRVVNVPLPEGQAGQWTLLLDRIQAHAGWLLEARPTKSPQPETEPGTHGTGPSVPHTFH